MFRAIPLNGRGSLTSLWGLFWILVCLHQLYYGWFMVRSSFVPYVMDGNETFSVWWHAHNLYTFSFWKSFGLTDEAFSFNEASHPFFHTHQGNMPRMFGVLIYALGARTVEAQVLVTTLIIGNLTLFFCYASIAKITRPLIAFVFCLFLFSDYLLYAQWHVVTYRVWYGFLFFGTMFAVASTTQEDRVWPYVLLGVLFFLLFYFELVFAGYVSIVAGFLGLWLHWGWPGRIAKQYSVQVMGIVAGVGLLFVQLLLALGFDVIKTDFSTTFLARNAAVAGASVDSIGAFFQNHNIAFWMNFRDGASLRTTDAFVRSIGTSVFQIWTPAFYILVIAPFIGIIISFFEARSKERSESASLVPIAPPLHESVRIQRLNGLPFFGPSGILALCAGAALVSGIGLVILEMFKSGLLFGVPSTATLSDWRWLFAAAMNVPFMAIFVAYFLRALAVKTLLRPAYLLLFLLTVLSTAALLFEVSLPAELIRNLTIDFDLTLPFVLAALAMSAAALVFAYFIAPDRLPAFRGTMACTLTALVLVKNPALFDQNYSDVWLELFQNWKVRGGIRAAALLTAGAGIAIAYFGARRSLGPIWRIAVARALALFFMCLAGYTMIYIFSPGYVLSGYAERLAPFAIFFVVFIPAIAACATLIAGRRCWLWSLNNGGRETTRFVGRAVIPTCLVFALTTIFLFWVRVQTYYASILPPNHLAFAKSLSLPPFKGMSFAVNNYSAVVAYYAHNWASMDMLLAKPMFDPLDGKYRRLTNRKFVWFADWNSNAEYQEPKYYACMKTPSFDSALALRDPKRFGHRFAFCDSEATAWESSPFNDRVVARDHLPARFWSVVSLGAARPILDDISVLVRSLGGKWAIDDKLAVKFSPGHPVTSKVVELLVGSKTSCDSTADDLKAVQTKTDDSSFTLPLNFVGSFRLRVKVGSDAGESDWKSSALMTLRPDSAGAAPLLHRCGAILADGPFTSSGLSSPAAGWGDPEPWGVWTLGPYASLRPIPVPRAADSDLVLDADVRAFLPGQGKMQRVAVFANGTGVAKWTFSEADAERALTVRIPKSVMTGHSALSLSFEISDPASPASLGLSADRRALGFGIKRLTIKEVEPGS
ncbi:hypothetical protein [Bradyrhizobium liaoningense]